VATTFWLLGGAALLVWFLWNGRRYFTAVRRAESAAGPWPLLDRPRTKGLRRPGLFGRAQNPAVEAARRWVWVSFVAWLLWGALGSAALRALFP
jgi:hypothetical protein